MYHHEIYGEYARTLIRVKARQLIRCSGFCKSDQEDIEQDLLLHLFRKLKHFDPQRGSFNTFAARVVDSAVGMLLRKSRRYKRVPLSGVSIQSLSLKVDQPDGVSYNQILCSGEREKGGVSCW